MGPSTGKPLDVGTGVVAASFGRDGSWLSIGCLHPQWGFVELSGLPPFPEGERGDPAATRRYRALMASGDHAWLRLEAADATRAVPAPAGAAGAPGSRWITQRWEVGDRAGLVVRGSGRLDRPALAEITEVNPPVPTGAVTELRAEGGRLRIEAASLPAVATVEVSDGRWVLTDGGAELRLDGGPRTVDISVALGPGLEPPVTAPEPWVLPPQGPQGIGGIVERALTYVRSCTALAFAPGERAILTDHRILPLSWTRDAYFQALLLLAGGLPGDVEIVGDHLRWVWRRCERPDGRWMRSHHGNGRPKDLAFQADQQLYPFVELADYWRSTWRLPRGVAWNRAVPGAWRAVLGAIDPATGLVATEENAADDRIEAPFSAGSQVLLWYTATRLAERGLASAVGLESAALLATAAGVRDAFERRIVHDGRWAYAVDGDGRTVDYHDANEFPTALAPLWGFCRRDDPGWLGTMAFAFSPANPGFVDGAAGGLGSRHTPGVWPLGLVQAWLVSRIRGDAVGAAVALERLDDAAFGDGMLPEAIVRDGGAAVPVRHWFAWPGAAFGALWLLDGASRLDVLEARTEPGTARAAPG
jgi:hypothetical protein